MLGSINEMRDRAMTIDAHKTEPIAAPDAQVSHGRINYDRFANRVSRTRRNRAESSRIKETSVKSDLSGFRRIEQYGRCFLVRVKSAESGFQQAESG